MTKTKLVLGCAAAALMWTATPTDAGAQSNPKTLKAVVHADLKIIDPVWTTAYITQRHSYLVYDTLFGMNSEFQPKPQMVESFTISDDRLTYNFKLRPGLKFHDGQPVKSADVIASVKRWAVRDPMGQKLAEFVKAYEAVDDSTFRMVLKEPYGLTLNSLAKASSAPFIMPERLANTPAMTQIKEPIGSGPFIFKSDEWQPGNKTVYVKNTDYIPRNEPPDYMSGGKVVKIDRLEWLYIPDNNTTLSALLAGEIDYFEAPPLDFIPSLQKNPDITVLDIEDKLGTQGLLRPNSAHPPFNDYRARQALLYLVNQEEYMRAVVGNPDIYKKFCGAYFLCGSDNETDAGSEPLKEYNIEKAKQLLKEAGYKGEKIVVLQPTDRPQYNAATMVTIQNLRKAGVNVDAQAADWSTIAGRRARKDPPEKGGWHIFHTTHGGPDTANPVSNVWFNSKCDRANPGWACDPELEKIIDQWAREEDPEKRRSILEDMHRRAFVSVPYVNWGQFSQPIAFRSNVKGVLKAPMPIYWNIEKQ